MWECHKLQFPYCPLEAVASQSLNHCSKIKYGYSLI